jgi:hypothetical protein
MRAQMGAAPIQAQPLAENLTLLSGPGGNVVVLNGPDGKIVVDTFLMPAWPKLKETLDGLGNVPLQTAIDTHWQFPPQIKNPPMKCAFGTLLVGRVTIHQRLESRDGASSYGRGGFMTY